MFKTKILSYAVILAHIKLEPNLEIAVSHILSAGFFFVQNNALCENDCQIICLVKICCKVLS